MIKQTRQSQYQIISSQTYTMSWRFILLSSIRGISYYLPLSLCEGHLNKKPGGLHQRIQLVGGTLTDSIKRLIKYNGLSIILDNFGTSLIKLAYNIEESSTPNPNY